MAGVETRAQAFATTSRTSMSSSVTPAGMDDLTCWLAEFAASSDSKTIIDIPESLLRVQYPVTNPGAWETRGTTTSRSSLRPASWSLIVTLTTTACIAVLHLFGSGEHDRIRVPMVTGKLRKVRVAGCEGR